MNTKAQSISITTIIIAILAILVLVVLFFVFTGRMGQFGESIDQVCPGECADSCDLSKGILTLGPNYLSAQGSTQTCKDLGQTCCSKKSSTSDSYLDEEQRIEEANQII